MEREISVRMRFNTMGLSPEDRERGYKELSKEAKRQGVKIGGENFYCGRDGSGIYYIFCGNVKEA